MNVKINILFLALSSLICCIDAQSTYPTKTSRKIDEYLIAYENLGFSGAIIVVEKGKITLHKGYGFANDSSSKKVDSTTVWTIGSITKPFTATAILQLEEKGKLNLQASVRTYLPELNNRFETVTIHQLLTHTAGMPEYSGYDKNEMKRDQFIKFLNDTELRSQPGDAFHYSNVGYSLLGIIIEQLSGAPYEEYLKKNIFDPAGMTQTGYSLPEWNEENFAIGYDLKGDSWGSVFFRNTYSKEVSWNLKANGGLLSTPLDILRWHKALQNNTLLSDESKKAMFTKHATAPDDFSPFNDKSKGYYGYGWGMTESGSFNPIIMHGGSNDIFEAGYMFYPQDEIFYFITSNRVRKNAVPAIFAIDKIISRKKYQLPEPALVPDKGLTDQYTGTYSFDNGSTFTIAPSEPPTPFEGALTVRPMDKYAYNKIVGVPIDENEQSEFRAFITNVLEMSKSSQPFETRISDTGAKKNKRDDNEEVILGRDERPLNEQINSYWKKSLKEKGEPKSMEYWGTVRIHESYWTLYKIEYANDIDFINFSIRDGEIKRVGFNDRPIGLLLKPKSEKKYAEVNNEGQYEFSTKSNDSKIKMTLNKEKYSANKVADQ